MISNKHVLFRPIKQSLALLREEDAIALLVELVRDYPSVVSVDILYTKDIHKMAEPWIEKDDAPHGD